MTANLAATLHSQQETLQKTARAATSKSVQRAVVNLSLLLAGSLPLLFLATVSTVIFYRNYLPDQVIETPIYLQYGAGLHPFGTTSLSQVNLKSQQAYDITVTLTMPRSPANTERGNFMVSLYFLNSEPAPLETETSTSDSQFMSNMQIQRKQVLFASKRPALVPYTDPIVSLAKRTFFLLYHMVFPDAQILVLEIPMAERVQLASQQSGLPLSAYVEVAGGQTIETYSVALVITAQLSGLRWLMHRYRMTTFLIATISFWAAEMAFMFFAWLALAQRSSKSPRVLPEQSETNSTPRNRRVSVKTENDESDTGQAYELSDIPSSIPWYSGAAIKEEPLPGIRSPEKIFEPVGIEADDEAEEDEPDWKGDSGIGTSFSEDTAGTMRRRSSHRR